jgi:hypothetical protein
VLSIQLEQWCPEL